MTTVDWSALDAVLFDLDGVLTPTAEIHERAWKEMFDSFLATVPVRRQFSASDYLHYVDGKPRFDGVRSFVAVPRDRPPRGLPRRPAGVRIDRFARQHEERDVPDDPAPRRHRRVPRLGAHARRPDGTGHRDGGRVVVAQRARGARGVRPRPSVRGGGRRDGRDAGSDSAASRHPTPSWRRRRSSAYRPTGPSSPRTRSPVSRPDGPAASASSSGSTGAPGTTRCAAREPTSSSTIWPNSLIHWAVREAAHRPRPTAPAPLPGPPVAVHRARVLPRPAAADRDAVLRRQRVPRPARRSRRGPRRMRPRHVRQRLPRDLEHPPRRGGVRFRHHRPDDRQRARRQDDLTVGGRRAVRPRRGGPRRLRAGARHAPGNGEPRAGVAHAGGQGGASPL